MPFKKRTCGNTLSKGLDYEANVEMPVIGTKRHFAAPQNLFAYGT